MIGSFEGSLSCSTMTEDREDDNDNDVQEVDIIDMVRFINYYYYLMLRHAYKV